MATVTVIVTQNTQRVSLAISQDIADMTKVVYDTNNSGKVDDSEKVNGKTVETSVPAGAKFTDTIYDDTALALRVTLVEGRVTVLEGAPPVADVNNYVSTSPPQLFNPDAAAVAANTDDYTLTGSNDIAFVTINGQTLDDSEYSLAASILTVTPDNGFTDITDEVLVFQFLFTTIGTGGVVTNYRVVSTSDTQLDSDHIVHCNDTLTYTFLTAVGNRGKEVIIKNTSASKVVTLDGDGTETIEGQLTQTLLSGDSNTYFSDGAGWVLGSSVDRAYTQQPYIGVTSAYTILESDYTIDCTANSFILSLSSTVAGKPYEIINSGSGIITLNMTINGETNLELLAGEAFTIRSNGTSYILT
jgi:hypothetical protein